MWLVELEPVGSRVARSVSIGQVAPARLLPGPRRLPRQGPCRGSPPRPLALWYLWSWRCLGHLVLRLLSGSPPLPCLVWPWRAAPTARAQVKGYKDVPLLLYTDRSPRAWATHKRSMLLGQPQNGARAVRADFTAATVPFAALLHDSR